MVRFMMENGLMDSNMVKHYTLTQKDNLEKVYGKMVKELNGLVKL